MRIYIYLVLAVVFIAAGKWAHSTVYKSGWNAAVVEQDKAIREAKDEAVKTAKLEWEATAAIAGENIVIEERIVEVERIVEKKIPQIVERIVTVTPECNDLGIEFAGLLNEQVRASANRSNDSADIAAELNP